MCTWIRTTHVFIHPAHEAVMALQDRCFARDPRGTTPRTPDRTPPCDRCPSLVHFQGILIAEAIYQCVLRMNRFHGSQCNDNKKMKTGTALIYWELKNMEHCGGLLGKLTKESMQRNGCLTEIK